ncbi:nucleoside deaminase [Candidatus Contubernalis alkaliaceticus]|uniref:nucleoside deaminase n=1 Tax=Candidatus Contubernalis alkaliaceticus TaxID=338645 RepID=UPI001F4BEB12|nr:nucleoside deaminase [Candidatus Contubernalis alkalaceticus]UNC93294.1 nucleoside deaminase [Candidatus Contubernalis alkalaceticus]
MNKYMKAAYNEALENIKGHEGGPFGAVIVKDGEIIAAANNQVLATNDPTMHAEIAAIRIATQKLGRFSLDDCSIYATCEPCPMCMAAIIWARIPKLYYGTDRKDAEAIGFADNYIYDFITGVAAEKRISVEVLDRYKCIELFDKWMKKEDKEMY